MCWYCNLSKREMFSVFFNFNGCLCCFCFCFMFFFVYCDVVDTYSGCKCVLIKTDPPSALIWYATTCHQSKLSSSIGSYFVDICRVRCYEQSLDDEWDGEYLFEGRLSGRFNFDQNAPTWLGLSCADVTPLSVYSSML